MTAFSELEELLIDEGLSAPRLRRTLFDAIKAERRRRASARRRSQRILDKRINSVLRFLKERGGVPITVKMVMGRMPTLSEKTVRNCMSEAKKRGVIHQIGKTRDTQEILWALEKPCGEIKRPLAMHIYRTPRDPRFTVVNLSKNNSAVTSGEVQTAMH